MSEESKFVPLTEISQGGSWADDQEEPTTQPEPKARSVWGKVQDVQAIDIAKLAEDDKKAKAEAAENSQWTQVNQPGARRPPGSGRTEGSSYNRDGGSSYNRDNFNRDGGSGGYNRDGGSGYNRGSFSRDGGSGGFNRDGGAYGDSASRAPREKQAPPDSPPFQAFVGNLSFEVTEDTLAEYFGELGVSNVRIVRDEGGRSKGFGYVEFNTKDGLVNALAADKAELNGRGMNVDVASAKPQRERTKLEWGHSGDGTRNSFGGDRERNDRAFGERGFGGDRDRGFGGDRDRSFGGDRGGRSFGNNFQRNAPPAERPRVNVAPRSEAPPASAPASASSLYGGKSENPFGAAMSDIEKQNKFAQDRLKREKEKEEAEKKRREEIERRAKEESDRPKGGFGDGRGWRGGGGDVGSPQRNGSGARGGSSAGSSGGRGGSSVGRGGGAGDRGDRGDRGGRGGGRGGRGGSSAEERGRRWDNEEGGEQTQPQQRKEKPAPYVKEEKGPAKPSNPYDLLSVEGGAGDEEGDQ